MLLKDVPLPPKIWLAERLAPVGQPRVALALVTTLLSVAGVFTVYTYFSVVFDRTVGGNPPVLGALLVLWEGAGTVVNIRVGRVIGSVGTRRILLGMFLSVGIVLAPLPLSSMHLRTAVPAISPVVLGLNTASTYLGVTGAGPFGAPGVQWVGPNQCGTIGAFLIGLALIAPELVSQRIMRVEKATPVSAAA